VIGLGEARRLRAVPENAIHVESPLGGPAARYRRAAEVWKGWVSSGLLLRDEEASFYLVEIQFPWEGRRLRRMGLICELGLDAGSSARVLAHERTLPGPREDRRRLLEALRVNTSPVFLLFRDPSGSLRSAMDEVSKGESAASGSLGSDSYRLWRVPGARSRFFQSAFRSRSLLIADGHHRYATARLAGSKGALACLCAEEDPGLVVLPTHRVVGSVPSGLSRRAKLRKERSLESLRSALEAERSSCAFGLFDGSFRIGVPLRPGRGAFGARWLAERALGADPGSIRYFRSDSEAVSRARGLRGAAFLLKPFRVGDVRRAVRLGGLLPQKSTYFHPKVASGLVFRTLDENP
jgi:uncharacterized protein (DUF1015 family)